MKIQIQMIIDYEHQKTTKNIGYIEREKLSPETLGLSLAESKMITSGIQKTMIPYQIKEYTDQAKFCPDCEGKRVIKGYHPLVYRTLFGKIHLKSPRIRHCNCHSTNQSTFSPLSHTLCERISPELSYLESKWASSVSYGMTAQLLEDVFPFHTHASSVLNNTHKVSSKLENEFEEEKFTFIEGCPRDWENLPKPNFPLEVALDGGYIHAREGDNRKAGWFEVIVGKSLQEQKASKRFGFVTSYDKKPKRRLHTMLMHQDLTMNQDITFLTDGGDTVRDLPLYLSPQSDHILDWFHIAMRFTVLKQTSKNSVVKNCPKLAEALDRAKWYLWHGNVFRALQVLEDLEMDLEEYADDPKESRKYKLWKAVHELYRYIEVNEPFIPNYGERYRNGESISSAFAESTVNELITRRMVKKQQMRWTREGAHLLLQLRVKNLNNELRPSFEKWYPQMQQPERTASNSYLH